MEGRYVCGKSVTRHHAPVKKSIKQLAAIGCFGWPLLILFRGILRRLFVLSTFRRRVLFGPDPDRCVDSTNAIVFQVGQKNGTIFRGKLAWNPGRYPFLQKRFIGDKPSTKIMDIEYCRSVTKTGDTAENGKQIVRLRGIKVRQPVLMIPLEQESSDMTPRNFAVIKRQLWIDNASTNHSVRFCKIVLIVAVCAAECDYSRNSIATATSSPCTLLIVRTSWGHIAQGHAG